MEAKKIFGISKLLTDTPFHFCPGCSHGLVHRLVAECIEELDRGDDTIGVASVGCSVFNYKFFNCDFQQAAHGRAPAVATGVKRANPDNIVFTYQGDGDLGAIGCSEIVYAALRGENITVFFINNAIYGMTGWQMAPTTIFGQKASTSPAGRDKILHGNPLKVSELLSAMNGPAYIERTAVSTPKAVRNTKRAIKKALTIQSEKKGFTLVEILSGCPTYWVMSAADSLRWIDSTLAKEYPLGVYKDITAEKEV
jgi:2-oxoglutarate ferredoxin oxidoreductase subunit beta